MKIPIPHFATLLIVAFLVFALSARSQTTEELLKQIQQAEQSLEPQNQAQLLNKLAYKYWDEGDYTKAINTFKKSISLNQSFGNTNALITLHTNIGLLYSEKQQFTNATEAFKQSLNLAKKHNRKAAQLDGLINLGTTSQSARQHKQAIEYSKQAQALAQELNDIQRLRTVYGLLAENYEALNNSQEAFKYFNLFSSIDKHLKSEEIKQIKDQSALEISQLAKEKQQKEQVLTQTYSQLKETKDSLKQSAALAREQYLQLELNQVTIRQQKIQQQNQRLVLFGFIGIFFLVSAFLLIVFKQNRQKQKANKQLSEQNALILTQKSELEEQHALVSKQKQSITDSISYARRIQQAIMPPKNYLEQNLPNHFIFFMPRDIVSGDFYWALKRDEKIIIAAADCTGHGVPGAMMSMLGTAFLNEIVNKMVENKHITALQPNEILNQLRSYIITSLHQTGEQSEAKDGIDIALVVLDIEQNKAQFAGAHNPLIIIRNNEIIEFKGDRMPVSIHRNANKPFSNHEIQLQPNDKLYLFSDGFVDQLGGQKGKKYMSRRFKEFLLSIHTEPMEKQKQLLKQEHLRWRNTLPQLDDLLVIGLDMVKVSETEKSPDAYDWHAKTILIAEDTDMNYLFLVEALKPTGVNVMRAHDGLEAIEICENNRFIDLVLMDINMPNVNGFEATERIKANRNIPVIAQTALNINEAELKSKEAGCDAYILKPIQLKVFLSTIAKFF